MVPLIEYSQIQAHSFAVKKYEGEILTLPKIVRSEMGGEFTMFL